MKIIKKLILHNNNKISIALTKNIKNQYYIKFIGIQYHYIWKLVNKKYFIVKQISHFEIIADNIIKILFTKIFKKD